MISGTAAFIPCIPASPRRFRNPTTHRPPLESRQLTHNTLSHARCSRICRRRNPCMQAESQNTPRFTTDRNTFLRFMAASALSLLSTVRPEHALADIEYATYKGALSLGFSFSYPTSWVVTKKAIKTHLSEVLVKSNHDASTTAGLVVDAVKIDSIDKFGTPEAVAQKVVDVENKKESVNSATVQSATSETKDGLTYFVIDYIVESSRGEKRYLAKATVTGNQLYVFTAQAKRDAFQGETADTLSKMLHSFQVVKQYS